MQEPSRPVEVQKLRRAKRSRDKSDEGDGASPSDYPRHDNPAAILWSEFHFVAGGWCWGLVAYQYFYDVVAPVLTERSRQG